VNRAVQSVRLTNPFIFVEGTDLNLYDDGTHGDATPGDHTYTSAALSLRPGLSARRFGGDPRAPEGVVFVELTTEVLETDGATSGFLVMPSIGVLSPDIPLREVRSLGSSVQASDHFFNVRNDDTSVQTPLRGWGGDLSAVTRRFYSQFGDDYDFFMLWSIDKLEAINPTTRDNFTAGRYVGVRHEHTGNALSPFDQTASYGSQGRLLGVALIDQGHRGMYGGNLAHELTHQWSAFTLGSLGLQDDSAHWASRSSTGSIVGGFQWLDNGDGTFTVNAEVGRNAVYEMAPLDRYFAGFIGPDDVPPVLVALPGTPLQDGYVVSPEEIERRVSVADIIAVHGPREPGPATSRKSFRVAVGTISNGRLLTAEEMTLYDILAEAAFRPLEPDEPLPLLDFGWPTLSGYFGPGTELRGELVSSGCSTCVSPLFGFERTSDWSSAAMVTLDTTTFTQGAASLSLDAHGWTPLTSRRFSTAELPEVTDHLALDLFIPVTPSNPFWLGELHLSIDCPSAGLYSRWIGNQPLTGRPWGEFSTLTFSLPDSVTSVLRDTASDCAVQLVLNAPAGSTPWLFDNMRFVP
jgi:hypothetical protein